MLMLLIQTSSSHSDVLNISSNPLHVLQTSVSHIISPLISSGGAENNETRLNIEHCCSQFANFPAAPSLNIFEEPNIAAGQPLIGEWLPLAEHCASCIYIMSRYIQMYLHNVQIMCAEDGRGARVRGAQCQCVSRGGAGRGDIRVSGQGTHLAIVELETNFREV